MSDVLAHTGQLIGRAVDTRPAERPGDVILLGRYGAVERLNPSKHGASLWEAVRDHDTLWTYTANGPFADEDAFSIWLASRKALADPWHYVIVEQSGRAVELATLMSIRPDMRVVEVGSIVLSSAATHHAGDRGAVSAGALCIRNPALPPL